LTLHLVSVVSRVFKASFASSFVSVREREKKRQLLSIGIAMALVMVENKQLVFQDFLGLDRGSMMSKQQQ
jgi:hypothetical protein